MINERTRNILLVSTAAAVIILILALIALMYNIVSIANLSARQDMLEEKSAKLAEIIENNEDELEYRQTSEFIESYAREYLGMKYDGEEVYEAE